MKKILSVLCALMMSLSPFTAAPSFFAADVSAAAASDTAGDQKIEKELRKGLTAFDKRIKLIRTVQNYDESKADEFYKDIQDTFAGLMTDKEFFYVEDSLTLSGWVLNNTMHINVDVSYITDKSYLNSYKYKFDKALKNTVSGVDKKWTDLQKAAYLHDTLILNTSYLKDDASRYTATPYAALADGKALCVGYARAYSILLSEVGIKSMLVDTADHEWNLVKIGGSWYHVDCTYDDSYIDNVQNPYTVFHTYFLKSDAAMSDHGTFSPAGMARSTTYDDFGWKDPISPFAFYGNGIIYNDGSSVKVYNTSTKKTTKLFSVTDKWEIHWMDPSPYYEGVFDEHWLSIEGNHSYLAPLKDKIYYNKAHAVYRYDPKTGKIQTIYTNKESDDMITELYFRNGKLYASFMDRKCKEKTRTIKISA